MKITLDQIKKALQDRDIPFKQYSEGIALYDTIKGIKPGEKVIRIYNDGMIKLSIGTVCTFINYTNHTNPRLLLNTPFHRTTLDLNGTRFIPLSYIKEYKDHLPPWF